MVAAASYVPGMFWLPGGLVSVSSADTTTFLTSPTFMDDTGIMNSVSPMTTEAGQVVPQIFAQRCSSATGNEWISCLAGNSNGNNAMPNATVLQYGYASGGQAANLKGRLNFTSSQSGMMNSGEIVTLVDSNPAKTLATPGNRAAADAGDTFLGADSGSTAYGNAGLAVGAPVSISSYINSLPNGTGFLERLTAGAKTFNVPVTVNGNVAVTSGTVTLPITGSTQCLHVSSSGVVSGTGSDCGSGGGGGGSGTVNSGTASQIAMYAGNGAAVSGDSALSDNGTMLSYTGSGGISAASGNLSGNLTLGGQLLLTGPWLVNSPIPPTAMASAGSGTSSLGISSDGNFYVSANGGVPSQIVTTSSATFSGTSTFTGPVSGTSASFAGNVTVGGQIIGTGPWAVSGPVPGAAITAAAGTSQAAFDTNGILTVSENGGPATQVAKVSSNITGTAGNLSGTQNANYVYAAPNVGSGAAGFRALVAADIPTVNQNTTGTAANLSGTPALPNGTTATTQGVGDSSNKLATTGFTTANFAAMSATASAGDYPKITSNNPTPAIADSGVLAGPYTAPWLTIPRGGGNASFTQNTVKMWGVVLTYPLLTSTVAYNVTAADNTANNYDIGIANASGTIVLNVGATAGTSFAPGTGSRTLSWLQAPKVLQPGKYYVVFTTSCASSCATVASGSGTDFTFQNAGTAGTTLGGALVNFTPPAEIWSVGAGIPVLAVK
jgi:hypothetical protein